MNTDGFLGLVRRYTDIQTLTHEILHEFIDKVVVHHRENIHGETVQKVEIHYNMIGHVEIPHMNREQTQMYVELFGRNDQSRSA